MKYLVFSSYVIDAPTKLKLDDGSEVTATVKCRTVQLTPVNAHELTGPIKIVDRESDTMASLYVEGSTVEVNITQGAV